MPASVIRLLAPPYVWRDKIKLLQKEKKRMAFSVSGIKQVSKPEQMICQIKFGSHLYGTATEKSDIDFKGIFLPTAKEILLGRIPKTFQDGTRDDSRKNLPGEEDSQYYSLHHFIRLASQGQTVAIDMLFAPENCVFKDPQFGWIWDKLVENRQRLLSKDMNAFVGYARGQAFKYSLKGERLTKLSNFVSILDTVNEGPLSQVWITLPKDAERINPQGIRELQIGGKWFGESTGVQLVKDAVSKQIARYGVRANAASDAGGIDWKALSHAVRVTKELVELVSFKHISFPLKDADLILAIKKGEVPLEKVQQILDADFAFVEFQTNQSTLPDSVDMKWCDSFLYDIIEQSIK